VLSPLEESGTTGDTIYKADMMLDYTFSEFEGNELSNFQNRFQNAQDSKGIQ